MTKRQARLERKTKETEITLALTLDGSGDANVATGIGFLDHMLNQVALHGLFDHRRKIAILLDEFRGKLLEQADHVVGHQYLAVAIGAGADAGVGAEEIDRPDLALGALDHPGHVGFPGDVGAHGDAAVLGGGVRIRQWHEFARYETLIPGVLEVFEDGLEIEMPGTRVAVGIGSSSLNSRSASKGVALARSISATNTSRADSAMRV